MEELADKFTTKSYNLRLQECQAKVTEYYPNMDLSFLSDNDPLSFLPDLTLEEYIIFGIAMREIIPTKEATARAEETKG